MLKIFLVLYTLLYMYIIPYYIYLSLIAEGFKASAIN